MKLQLVGLSHHTARVEVRERLAFTASQAKTALAELKASFPSSEAVLLSTCNRMEIYTVGTELDSGPSHQDVCHFLAKFHGLEPYEIFDELFERTGEDAVRHLFMVAASLDSMVVGEPQILSQVKQAYDLALAQSCTGPLTNSIFQAALKVAKRVATETSIHEKRVSIPSVAVAESKRIFERFDNKCVLVVGAGEMAEETLRYLQTEGATQMVVVNRSLDRAEELADRFGGHPAPWQSLDAQLVLADLVVSTTGATEPVVTWERFRTIQTRREQRPLFVLDLAVPRDFDPEIGRRGLNVYLYSLDDLTQACERNKQERMREWPAAEKIIEEETQRFMAQWHHNATGPTIRRLREVCQETKVEELRRLFNRLPDLDVRAKEEIEIAFERLVNKLLHPPLESLRDEAKAIRDTPHALLDALKRLFQLRD